MKLFWVVSSCFKVFKLVPIVLGCFKSLEFFLVVLRCIRLCLVGGCCFKLIRLDLRCFSSLGSRFRLLWVGLGCFTSFMFVVFTIVSVLCVLQVVSNFSSWFLLF